MDTSKLGRVVVVGGSIAAVTAVETLRVQGFDGEITLVTDESSSPYSRIPLSKGVLSGRLSPESTLLPALADDISIRHSVSATKLLVDERRLILSDGESLPYDGLIVATGARARRLASPDQTSENVIRTLEDVSKLAGQIRGAQSVLIVGAGFLGMEVASTCVELGLSVTVIDRDLPLRRLLGSWLAEFVTASATLQGVRFVQAASSVELVGCPQICGVKFGEQMLEADVVVSAVGDIPNIEWLAGSGLPLHGGLLIDSRCKAAPHIVAAGDVTVTYDGAGTYRRTPHWTAAVLQGQSASTTLLRGDAAPEIQSDPYYWTEQFGLDIKISGEIPVDVVPAIISGSLDARSMLLQWSRHGRPVAAAAINHRMPVVKLKRLGALFK